MKAIRLAFCAERITEGDEERRVCNRDCRPARLFAKHIDKPNPRSMVGPLGLPGQMRNSSG